MDPERTAFFYRQSDPAGVHELAWLLSNVTRWAAGAVPFLQGQAGQGHRPEPRPAAYPVLMAADNLNVQANVVPVGKDQKQHVEVTRDLAIKFKQAYGETFTVPEPQISEDVAVVPGLDGQKMSKSYGNTIEIFGDLKATRKRIMSIVTDSKTLEEPKDPDACNVFKLFKLFATPAQQADLAARYRAGGMGYGHRQEGAADLLEAHFAPLRAKRAEQAANP
jgi:tryptophanyl-tRNA synthetase